VNRKTTRPRLTPPKPGTWYGDLFKRFVAAAFCCLFAVPLIGLGRSILVTGHYDFTVESSGGSEPDSSFDRRNVRREEYHETGDWAREQGIGILTGGITFGYWALLFLFGPTKTFSTTGSWSWLGTLLVGISFLLSLASLVFLFPPWRIGAAMSSNAFYIALTTLTVVACLGLGKTNKDLAGKVFGGLCLVAIVMSNIWSGYLGGTVGGIFGGVLLASHVVLLVPKLRNQAFAEA
jgi:hypothetical protein